MRAPHACRPCPRFHARKAGPAKYSDSDSLEMPTELYTCGVFERGAIEGSGGERSKGGMKAHLLVDFLLAGVREWQVDAAQGHPVNLTDPVVERVPHERV
jgi:hypothetical protein